MSQFATTIVGRLLEPALTVRMTLTLLHFLWQGALLGLVAFAADRAMRRASSRTRYAFFVGILATMGAALPATFLLVDAGKTRIELAPAPVPTSAPVVMTNASPAPDPRPDDKASLPAASEPAAVDAPFADLVPADAFTERPQTAKDSPPEFLEPFAGPVTAAYLTGILLMLTRLAIALEGGRRLRSAATPIPDGPIAELVRRQATQLGLKTAPLVAWCTRISVPVVVGIVRPMILLPGALAAGFDPSQLEALLTHELAHIRRFDPLVNLLQRLIEVALFFHPAVWYVSRCVSAERENACDDLVVEAGWARLTYADALLRMAERSAAAKDPRTHQPASATLAASGEGSSQFKRRVLRLLEIGDSPRMRLSRGGLLLLAGAAILVFSSSPLIRAVTKKPGKSKSEEQIAQASPKADPQAGAQTQSAAPARSAAEFETLARIFAAWKARQEHAASFHVTWQTRMTMPKSARFYFDGNDLMAGLPSGGHEAKTDIDFTFPQSEFWGGIGERLWRRDFPRIVLDEMGARHACQAYVVHVRNATYRLEVPVGNSVTPWTILRREGGVEKDPPAGAEAVSRSRPLDLNFAPLLFALRPLSDWSAAHCRVVNENANIRGVPCIEICKDTPGGAPGHAETCWVDPQRDYVVVFYERGKYTNVRSVFIEYERSPADGWIPSQWTWETRESWRPGEQKENAAPALFRTSVTRYALNEKFKENPFFIVAPPGTQAYDLTRDRELEATAQQAPATPSAEDRKTLEAIKAAWSQRQARFKSFQCTARREPAALRGRPSIHTASADGKLFALESSDIPPLWHEKTAFDGHVTRSVRFSDRRGSVGNATVKSGVDASVFNLFGNQSLWLGLCPLETPFERLDPSQFRVLRHAKKNDDTPRFARSDPGGSPVVRHTETVDDTRCVVVETKVSSQSRTIAWLDPARDYVISRQDQIFDSGGERDEFSYRLDAKQGWIPVGCRYTFLSNGRETEWASAEGGSGGAMADTVTEYRINQPLPPAVFQVNFPEGVPVQDKDADEARAAKARATEADAIAARWAAAEKPAWKSGGIDPQYNARANIGSALSLARETGKRVLIEFGEHGYPDCGKLHDLLKGNAQLSALVRKEFALVVVDTNYPNNGKRAYDDYVPKNLSKHLPVLCVLDAGGNLLNVDDTTELKTGNDYDVGKVIAYLEKWSPHK